MPTHHVYCLQVEILISMFQPYSISIPLSQNYFVQNQSYLSLHAIMINCLAYRFWCVTLGDKASIVKTKVREISTRVSREPTVPQILRLLPFLQRCRPSISPHLFHPPPAQAQTTLTMRNNPPQLSRLSFFFERSMPSWG